MKSDITSLDLRYKFCTDCGIFLLEISWLETEIPKNVHEGTNTMSVFIKCNGIPGSEWGCAGDAQFLGMPAMRTRWMAGAAAHKSG